MASHNVILCFTSALCALQPPPSCGTCYADALVRSAFNFAPVGDGNDNDVELAPTR